MDSMDKEREGDQWLDGALVKFGKAEPRTGLEGRLLTTLQVSSEQRAARRARWILGAAAATAAVVVAISFGPRSAERLLQPIAAAPTMAPSASPAPSFPRAHPKGANVPHMRGLARISRHEVPAAPRMEQFPSQRPLSREEQTLIQVLQSPAKQEFLARNDAHGPLNDLQIGSLKTPSLEVPDLEVAAKTTRKMR